MMKFLSVSSMPLSFGIFFIYWLISGYLGNISNILNVPSCLSYMMILLLCWLFISYTMFLLKEPKSYMKLILSYFFILCLFFSSDNIFMFYVSFELSILPIFLIILGWGNQPERLIAANYLLVYTLLFSFPLMVIILFTIDNYLIIPWEPMMVNNIVWLITLLPFFIKIPIYLLHLWLPKAHVEAPVLGSMLLASILLKTGGYGIWCVWLITLLPFFIKIPIYLLHLWLPKAHVEAPVLGSMLLASILLKTGGYGMLKMCNMYVITFTKELISVFLFMVLMATMLCLLQSDLKKFVAYSSVTHMTMLLILLFSEYISFENGSIFLMISHGVISNSLFFMVGVYSFSSLSRLLFKQDNIMMISPKLWYTCMIILFLNAGSPPSLSMISEMMLFINSHLVWSWNFIICSVMFLLLVYYPIWLMSNMNSVKMNLSNNIYVCTTDLLLLCYLPFSALILWLNSTTML
uniref:NADH-ubiquinone oxidoreductase chain 4 n=1 Tax=Trichuris suis TaxID=68888 RepID=A0A0M5M1X6_9BILA|nr:NADH dehydrogenase subunit 4 [Trichuris suis]